jgi:hypothetical protein
MSILDSFGKNEKSGLGGRTKGQIAPGSESYSSLDNTTVTINETLNSNSSSKLIISPQKQQQQLAIPNNNNNGVFDANMFGDNAPSISQDRQRTNQQNIDQFQFQIQQQQYPNQRNSNDLATMSMINASSSFHDLEYNDNDRQHLQNMNNTNKNTTIQFVPPVVFSTPPRQQNHGARAVRLSEDERRAMEDLVSTDDFIERFNAMSAQIRQQKQQQQKAPLETPKKEKKLENGKDLVPVCPSCFSKHVAEAQRLKKKK